MKTIDTNLFRSDLQKIFIFVLVFSIFSPMFSQPLAPTAKLNQTTINNKTNFYEIQKKMDDYWKSKNIDDEFYLDKGAEHEIPMWNIYKRWEYYWEQRASTKTGEFPQTNSVIEYQKYKAKTNALNKTTYNENWSNLGTNSSTGGYAGIGRINYIAFHPSDDNTFWVGSPSGGIWKTTNGGTSWTILNNDQLVLGVSDIAIPSDYETSNTLYIATGDRDGGSMGSLSGGQAADNVSIGVLKSTDGGVTWNTTGLTFSISEGNRITRLLISPASNSILFASVWNGDPGTSGIWKTTNAGVSWLMRTNNLWTDIEFKPGDPTVMYASSYGYGDTYINRSSDSGENWGAFKVAPSGRRGQLAVSAHDANIVYLLASNSIGGVNGIYKSTNSGITFAKVNNNTLVEPGMLGYYTDGSGDSSGQGSYDLCIAVNPSDENTIFIGGITTWKSTDGGVTWKANNNWTSSSGPPPYNYNTSGVPVVHADKHILKYQNNTTLFEGNDGGIYVTNDGGTTWDDLTNGMVISQVYRIGVSQSNSSIVLNGLQDNGSKLYNAGFWTDVTGGDGMECIVDFSDANYMYATYVRGEIYRSTNGGFSFPTTISANIPGGQPTGAWVTPYVIDPNSSSTLFAGYDKVWKTTDRGNNWDSVSQQLSAGTKLRSLAIAPSNSSVLYTADQTNMWKTTDGGATDWSVVNLPAISNYITYICVKNNDPSTLWITLGGYTDGSKVFESTDGGSSWTNISTGLPNLPVMSIVQYKTAADRNVLFVGTDVGVYVKDGANSWAAFNNGLPNVVVSELEILYTGGTDKLRAGTFGRGLWETDIDNLLPVELASFTASFKENHVVLNWLTKTEVNNNGFEVERKTDNSKTANWKNIGFVEGNGNSNTQKTYKFEDKTISNGTYKYRLKQIDNDGQFKYSNTAEVLINAIPKAFALSQNFPNPFNPSTKINYQISKSEFVSLRVYDILGNEVSTLVNEKKSPGNYEANFNAASLTSGVYFYQIKAGSFVQTKKMTLIK